MENDHITQYAIASGVYPGEGLVFLMDNHNSARFYESATAAAKDIVKRRLNFTTDGRAVPIWFPCLITEVKV